MIKARMMRWTGHVAHIGAKRNAYKVLVGNPEGNRPLRRFGRKWESNMNMDLKVIGCVSVDGIDLAENRDQWLALVNTVMHLRVL
jgi:hypothetical protein